MAFAPRSVFTERRRQPRRQAENPRRLRSRAASNLERQRANADQSASQRSGRPYLRAIPSPTASPLPQRINFASPQPPNESGRQRIPTLRTPALPAWLRLLLRVERGATFFAAFLGFSVLSVYGFTFYSQQVWSQEYEELQTLQRKERRLTSAIETLKQDAAKAAENPDSGLVPQNPASTIFLPAAPPTATEEVEAEVTEPEVEADASPTISSPNRTVVGY